MDVVANNVANVATAGFKRRSAAFGEFLNSPARGDADRPADRQISLVLERVGLIDLSDGAIERTGNPMDIALRGDAFLVVRTAAGERYTRNGALSLNDRGELVTSDGHAVISEQGPLAFSASDGPIAISGDGTVSTPQGVRGKLRLVSFQQPEQIQNIGDNLFASSAPLRPAGPAARVESGAIERSNVNSIKEIASMMEVSRSYASLAQTVQRIDETRRGALSKLAETA